MAYFDEIEIGDGCTVTDLHTGKQHHGEVVSLMPGGTKAQPEPAKARVGVCYDDGTLITVGPGFVRLDAGEV